VLRHKSQEILQINFKFVGDQKWFSLWIIAKYHLDTGSASADRKHVRDVAEFDPL
jgi:hypothetical protein